MKPTLIQATLLTSLILLISNTLHAQCQYTGTNLAVAEFGARKIPGKIHKDYTYPNHKEIDYFTSKGMNCFRLPFLMERLMADPNAPLTKDELGRIKDVVDYAASKNATTILDPHNYARYQGKVIGSEDMPVQAFTNFWSQLAAEFKNHPHVIFGLMNEPHGMKTQLWLKDANAAIAAIRQAGAKNLILVPGNAYSGAHSWTSNWYGEPNGTVMLAIHDPNDNYAFEVHQYLDKNSSGSKPECVSPTIGSKRLKGFTNWCKKHKKRAFLGEFGAADNPTALKALDDMLNHMDKNTDVYIGWTYWAAGPWWGDYMFSIEPKDGKDKPQLLILSKHMSDPK